MKTVNTNQILQTLRNATSPAARLAAWQNRPLFRRRESLAKYYIKTATLVERRKARIAEAGPDISSPEAEKPLLWLESESDSEVMETIAGRECGLNHCGYYADDYQDETLETYAVRLKRFPQLLFYAVKDSCSGDFRVRLDEWEEIDFSECGSDYDVSHAIQDAARQLVRSHDSTTEREAEESQEFYRKDQAERDIEENKETLAGLRQEIRALAHELKTLCPSPMAAEFPAAGKALRDSLQSLLGERRQLMAENEKLAASL